MVRTEAGWLDKKEVVEVIFDPNVTSYAELLASARCLEKPSTAFVYDEKNHAIAKAVVGDEAVLTTAKPRVAKASDQKYYLRQTPYGSLPLTEIQAARLNAIVGDKKNKADPRELLSPSQRKLLNRIQKQFPKKRKELLALQPCRDPKTFTKYVRSLEKVLRAK